MSGAAFEIDARELSRLHFVFARLSSSRLSDLMDAVGTEVESQTKRRIEDEKRDPTGNQWKPWSPAYAKTRHGNHSLLQNEDHLLDSITHNVLGDEIEVGSNLVYASPHQETRPYLGLSRDNETEVISVADEWLRAQGGELFR